MRRVLVALLVLVLLGSTAATAHLVWHSAKSGSDDARVAAQVRFLQAAIDDGAGARMQSLFPEGEFFTVALTGMAAANVGRRDPAQREWALHEVERALKTVESPEVADVFGQHAFEHGIFWRGWRAHLLVDRATLTGHPEDVGVAVQEATAILDAVSASPSGFPESYPGQAWPCDTVVAMAAVGRTTTIAAVPGWEEARDAWLDKADRIRVADQGNLLPHRVTSTGAPSGGVRATSQSIITSFWPDIDGPSSIRQWESYRRLFMTRKAGLLGVLEYPAGSRRGAGDVDSGPLVLGVSLSASATTLAAARRMGDDVVWRALDHEAEVFGLPMGGGKRSFAFGMMPVGDAFVAWARSQPVGDDAWVVGNSSKAEQDDRIRPRLTGWVAGAALPGLLAIAGLVALRRRRSSTAPTSDPAESRPRT